MAKLITKIKYLKPGDRKSVGGYAKYIATREGVDRIDDSQKHAPATKAQEVFINKLLGDFPEIERMIEYEDYCARPTMGNASELISRSVEEHAEDIMDTKTYADYIATRPRAQRFGSHGLFTDEGKQVQLSKVSEELNLHGGNVWTIIISLRREDAERLGYNTGERWRDMLRAQTQEFSDQFHIPMENLRWFGAFHNEAHHPHVHLMIYSTDEKQGFLSEYGVNKLRASLGKEIFSQDLLCEFEKQTEYRNELKRYSREAVAKMVEQINNSSFSNPTLDSKLIELANRLSKTGGKKQYGYLKADVKKIVDDIVSLLAADDRISELYDLWYEQREDIIRTYTEEMPERIPLEKNDVFKSIKNDIIKEAMNIITDRETTEQVGADLFFYGGTQDDKRKTTSSSPRAAEKEQAPHSAQDRWSAVAGTTRLMHHLARMIQNRIEDERRSHVSGELDRKLRRQIAEKKQAQGLKTQ